MWEQLCSYEIKIRCGDGSTSRRYINKSKLDLKQSVAIDLSPNSNLKQSAVTEVTLSLKIRIFKKKKYMKLRLKIRDLPKHTLYFLLRKLWKEQKISLTCYLCPFRNEKLGN
jgi:hypothetical protein